jgi:hypothetical protein
MAQTQTVRVQRRGRDVGFVLSPDEFRRLLEAASGRAGFVKRLHAESVGQWAEVYKALAK